MPNLPKLRVHGGRLLRDLGLRRACPKGLRREVRDFNAQFREEFLASHDARGWGDVPGFKRSVMNLINVQGYCMSDVADMIGVSRQRLEQLLIMYDIPVETNYGTRFRVWDDNLNRFVSMDTEDFTDMMIGVEVERREQIYLDEIEYRFQLAADVCRTLNEILGRAPSTIELAFGVMFFACDLSVHAIKDLSYPVDRRVLGAASSYLTVNRLYENQWKQAMNEVYARAGVERPDYRNGFTPYESIIKPEF